MTSSSFFGGERKHSHFPKLQSENVKILTSPSIFADVGTKITVMENILHAFSLDRTEPETQIPTTPNYPPVFTVVVPLGAKHTQLLRELPQPPSPRYLNMSPKIAPLALMRGADS